MARGTSDLPLLIERRFWRGTAAGFESEPHRIHFWLLLGLMLLWLASGYFAAPPSRRHHRAQPDDARDRIHRTIFHGISYAFVASVPMAVVCLLVTGDVSFNRPAQAASQPDVESTQHGLLAALIALQVIALFPLFKFGRLVESGVQKKSQASTAIFRVAAVGLIFGIPLFLFGVFVREDIARTVKNVDEIRPGVDLFDYHATQLLSASDFDNWSTFWRSALSRSGNDDDGTIDPVAARLVEASSIRDRDGNVTTPGEELIRESIRRHLDFQETNRELHWWHHLWPTYAVDVFVKDHKSLVANRRVMHRINRRVLSDPQFHEPVEEALAKALAATEDVRSTLNKDVVTNGSGETGEISRSSERTETLSTKATSPQNKIPPGADLERLALLVQTAKGLEQRADAHPGPSLRLIEANYPSLVGIEKAPEAIGSVRLLREIQKSNSDLLRAYYGNAIRPERTVYAYIVHRSDQRTRLWYALSFGAAFLVLTIVLNLNSLSLHHFYRDRLGHMWITGERNDLKLSELVSRTPQEPLLKPAPGLPYLLINATAHLKVDQESHAGRASLGKRGPLVRFLLSPLYCGCTDTGYIDTPSFERAQPEGFTLIDAVAISGGAVSPAMTDSFLLRTLLYLANLRLGLRVVNPAYLRCHFANPRGLGKFKWWLRRRATPISRFFDFRKAADAGGTDAQGSAAGPPRHVLLSDGGFYENLGIEALLVRRTRVIVAIDASQDSQGNFADLFRLVRRCRTMHGIRIHTGDKGKSISDEAIKTLCRRSKKWPTEANYVVACISYPPDKGEGIQNPMAPEVQYTENLTFGRQDGVLIYVKPVLTKDTDAALWGYSRENADFPNDPTVDQFYNERRFESYRQLGASIGEKVVQLIEEHSRELRDDKAPWLAKWPGAPAPLQEVALVPVPAGGGNDEDDDGEWNLPGFKPSK
ncbi:MAG: hypothetical protein M3552_05680 [Planctomycetota bacterium]|nr:hypothetical protein [Planctomycetota bacterium]